MQIFVISPLERLNPLPHFSHRTRSSSLTFKSRFIHLSLISISLAMLFGTAVEPKGMIVISVMPHALSIWLSSV